MAIRILTAAGTKTRKAKRGRHGQSRLSVPENPRPRGSPALVVAEMSFHRTWPAPNWRPFPFRHNSTITRESYFRELDQNVHVGVIPPSNEHTIIPGSKRKQTPPSFAQRLVGLRRRRSKSPLPAWHPTRPQGHFTHRPHVPSPHLVDLKSDANGPSRARVWVE